jgi:hypothetical protein
MKNGNPADIPTGTQEVIGPGRLTVVISDRQGTGDIPTVAMYGSREHGEEDNHREYLLL